MFSSTLIDGGWEGRSARGFLSKSKSTISCASQISAHANVNFGSRWLRSGELLMTQRAFFHFGGGMTVRNLCREPLSDDELSTYDLWVGWDDYYLGVIAAIAASSAASRRL
jgi:hypothetical protein